MTASRAQPLPSAAGTHLVLYDGVCGLCSRLVQFVLTHERRAEFDFASLQSPLGHEIVARCGASPEELTSFYVSTNYRTSARRLLARSDAALFVAGELGWPWRIARLLRVLPKAFLDAAYDLVARNRYRIFGRLEQCFVPRPEFSGRFVE